MFSSKDQRYAQPLCFPGDAQLHSFFVSSDGQSEGKFMAAGHLDLVPSMCRTQFPAMMAAHATRIKSRFSLGR